MDVLDFPPIVVNISTIDDRHSWDEIYDSFSKACKDGKKLSATFVNKFLEKYNIDINYDDGLLLGIVCENGSELELDYHNIKLLLDLGADPTLLSKHDDGLYYCRFSISRLNYVRLDTIFKMYGYVCDWGSSFSIGKANYKLNCGCVECTCYSHK